MFKKENKVFQCLACATKVALLLTTVATCFVCLKLCNTSPILQCDYGINNSIVLNISR